MKKKYAEYKIRSKQNNEKLKLTSDTKRYENEAPKILPSEESTDSQMICGSDDKGNSLLIKFTRRRHRVAEVWLVLRLQNGDSFTFPEHPNTRIVNATPRVFEGSGLKLECLIPYSKWRITYSGMLKKETAPNNEQNQSAFNFVRINFM